MVFYKESRLGSVTNTVLVTSPQESQRNFPYIGKEAIRAESSCRPDPTRAVLSVPLLNLEASDLCHLLYKEVLVL
jgi:hypothetical protein